MSGAGEEHREQASEVGALLRRRRVDLGRSIAEVARDVRIRQAFLEAIETGHFDRLPGGAYTIGFIRTYAEHLGLDANDIVRRFKLETGTRTPAAKLNFPAPLGESNVPKGAILLIGAIIALLGYGVWYVTSSRYLDVAELTLPLPDHLRGMLPGGHGQAATATASPDAAAAPLPKVEVAIEGPAGGREGPAAVAGAAPGAGEHGPAGTAPAVPAPAAPPVVPASPVPPSAPPAIGPATQPSGEPPHATPPAASAPEAPAPAVPDVSATRIALRASGDTWVEIRDPATRAVVFSRLMHAGDTFAVPDGSALVLRTGNAGGLEVFIDGASAGQLGKTGVVRRNVALDVESLRADLSRVE
ncbi:MAG: DUF4115 domain-containing protein [Rhodospirillales bacterium]